MGPLISFPFLSSFVTMVSSRPGFRTTTLSDYRLLLVQSSPCQS
uniref:Uncharacterized protein n=1 Tax=Arundo donax TaxID=35708 RepID=A0A0A9B6P9_ARUDO